MVSLACFKTLSQLVNSDGNELQNYLSSNRNVNVDDRDEVLLLYIYILDVPNIYFQHKKCTNIKPNLNL